MRSESEKKLKKKTNSEEKCSMEENN